MDKEISLHRETQQKTNQEVGDSSFSSDLSFTPVKNYRGDLSFATSSGFGSDFSGDNDNSRTRFFYDYSSSTDSILLLTPSPRKYNLLQYASSIASTANGGWKQTPRRNRSSKLSAFQLKEPEVTPPSKEFRVSARTEGETGEVLKDTRKRRSSSQRRKRRSSGRFLRHEYTEQQADGSEMSKIGIRSDGDLGDEENGELDDPNSDTGHDLLQMTPIPHAQLLLRQYNTLSEPETEPQVEVKEEDKELSTTSRRRSARRSMGSTSYSQQNMLKTTKYLTLSDLESSEEEVELPELTFRLEPGEGVSVRQNPDGSYVGGLDLEGSGPGLADDDLEAPPEMRTFRVENGDDERKFLRAEEQQNILGDLDDHHEEVEVQVERVSTTFQTNRIEREEQDLSQFTTEEIERSILSKPRRVIRDPEPAPSHEEEEAPYGDMLEEDEEGYDVPANGEVYYPELNPEIEDDDEPQGYYEDVNGVYEQAAYKEVNYQKSLEQCQEHEEEEYFHEDEYPEITIHGNADDAGDMNQTGTTNEQYEQEIEEEYLAQDAGHSQVHVSFNEKERQLMDEDHALNEQGDDDQPQALEPSPSRQSHQRRHVERIYPVIHEASSPRREVEPALASNSPLLSYSSIPTMSPLFQPKPTFAVDQSEDRPPPMLKRKVADTSMAAAAGSSQSPEQHMAAETTMNMGAPKSERLLRGPRQKRRRLELDWGAEHWSRLNECLKKKNRNQGDAEDAEGFDMAQEQEYDFLPSVPLRVRNEFPEFPRLELARRMLALNRVIAMKKKQHHQQQQQQREKQQH